MESVAPFSSVRHPIRYRRLVVTSAESLSRTMRRFVLTGDDLEGFTSLAFDDHVKVFFPDASGTLPTPIVGDNGVSFPEGVEKPAGRDFTPRRYDADRRALALEFGLHGSGPAATWARDAGTGSVLGIAGPRGSAILSDAFAWNLLIGDDTALPAIARRLEELPPSVTANAIIEVEDRTCQVPLASGPNISVQWVHAQPGRDTALDEAVASVALPGGNGFAWVAGETSMARRLRRLLIDQRGLETGSVKAAAYWTRGGVGRHEVIAD